MNKWVLAIVTIMVVVGGGLLLFKSQSRAPASSEPIKVGVAAAQTGFAAEWGQGEVNAVTLYIDQVNSEGGIDGRPIQLIIEDTKTDALGTTNAIKKLATIDKVPVTIGPTWADSFGGGNPIAETNKMVMITPSAALEIAEEKQNFDYLFSTFWTLAAAVDPLVRFVKENNFKKVVIVNNKDPFNVKFEDTFSEAVRKFGTKIVRLEVPIGEQDFRTTIIRIKQEHPDAISIALGSTALGPFLKQAKENNLHAVFLSNADAQNEKMVQDFGSSVDGLIYSYPKTPATEDYKNLVMAYEKKYGSSPSVPSWLNAYNAAIAVVAALRSGALAGDEIRRALYGMQVTGVGIGMMQFDARGQIANLESELKTIKNERFTELR